MTLLLCLISFILGGTLGVAIMAMVAASKDRRDDY